MNKKRTDGSIIPIKIDSDDVIELTMRFAEDHAQFISDHRLRWLPLSVTIAFGGQPKQPSEQRAVIITGKVPEIIKATERLRQLPWELMKK